MLLRQSVVPAGLALGPKSDIRKDVKRLIGTVFVRFLEHQIGAHFSDIKRAFVLQAIEIALETRFSDAAGLMELMLRSGT
jgi:hypothetical protein